MSATICTFGGHGEDILGPSPEWRGTGLSLALWSQREAPGRVWKGGCTDQTQGSPRREELDRDPEREGGWKLRERERGREGFGFTGKQGETADRKEKRRKQQEPRLAWV